MTEHVNSVVRSPLFLSHSISSFLSAVLLFKKGITDDQLGPLTLAPGDHQHVAYRDLGSHFVKEGSPNPFVNENQKNREETVYTQSII